jgi:protease-4
MSDETPQHPTGEPAPGATGERPAPRGSGDPLPTTPVSPPPAHAAPPQWGPAAWPGWPPAPMPPPAPPPRDRLALAVVGVVFGGLFLVFLAFLFLAYGAVKGTAPRLASGPKIGIVEVKGTIGGGAGGVESQDVLKLVKRFADDEEMRAVVVRIESPGGSVAPSQEIYDELGKLAERKVVVCSMGDIAASGGLYVALACPTIVAEPGTLTGSIGVISQFPNVGKLVERFDVKVETIKSGKLKDAGNPLRDMTEAEREYWQALVNGVYEQFVRAVVESRELADADVRKIADGRVLTGEQAKEIGLVDELGNFHDAVDIAMEQAGLKGDPRLVFPPDERSRFLEELMGGAVKGIADGVRAELGREGVRGERPGVFFLAR